MALKALQEQSIGVAEIYEGFNENFCSYGADEPFEPPLPAKVPEIFSSTDLKEASPAQQTVFGTANFGAL